MKVIMGVITVLVVLVGVMLFGVPSLSGGPVGTTPPVAAAEGDGANARADDGTRRDADVSNMPSRDRLDDEALARLQAELASSKPVASMTDEDRYEEALAWVQANRPADWPYQEVEARVLGILGTILDGERRSAGWLMDIGLMEIEMVRALDADGDGAITYEEMLAYSQADIQNIGQLDHPFLLARLDQNRDGILNDDERSVVEPIKFFQEGAFAGVFDRAMLNAWDTNNDGELTEAERLAGTTELASANDTVQDLESKMLEMEANGLFDGPDGEARRTQMETQLAQVRDSQNEASDIAIIELARPLIKAMTFESLEREEVELSTPPAQDPPTRLAFDTDGDGGLNPIEQQRYMDALDAFNAVQSNTGWQDAQYTKALFDREATIGDTNRDGFFTPLEWEAHLHNLSLKRDAELFRLSYDLDQDGRVDQTELTTFIDWYRAGSLRADSNYDGLIDARDLEFMMNNYQQQDH